MSRLAAEEYLVACEAPLGCSYINSSGFQEIIYYVWKLCVMHENPHRLLLEYDQLVAYIDVGPQLLLFKLLHQQLWFFNLAFSNQLFDNLCWLLVSWIKGNIKSMMEHELLDLNEIIKYQTFKPSPSNQRPVIGWRHHLAQVSIICYWTFFCPKSDQWIYIHWIWDLRCGEMMRGEGRKVKPSNLSIRFGQYISMYKSVYSCDSYIKDTYQTILYIICTSTPLKLKGDINPQEFAKKILEACDSMSFVEEIHELSVDELYGREWGKNGGQNCNQSWYT